MSLTKQAEAVKDVLINISYIVSAFESKMTSTLRCPLCEQFNKYHATNCPYPRLISSIRALENYK